MFRQNCQIDIIPECLLSVVECTDHFKRAGLLITNTQLINGYSFRKIYVRYYSKAADSLFIIIREKPDDELFQCIRTIVEIDNCFFPAQ